MEYGYFNVNGIGQVGVGVGEGIGIYNEENMMTEVGWFKKRWKNEKNRTNEYRSSKELYEELYEEYGEETERTEEYIEWREQGIYKSIRVYDRVLENTFPYKHNNIMELEYKKKIKEIEEIEKIERISSDIEYDKLREVIRIRCPNKEYGASLLRIILEYMKREVLWYELNTTRYIEKRLNKKRLKNIKIKKEKNEDEEYIIKNKEE